MFMQTLKNLALLCLLVTAAANARADAIAQCNALAAHPYDKTNPASVEGVPYDDVDGERAKVACTEALAKAPSPRIHYQLGRAFEALDDIKNARIQYEKAVQGKHVRAYAQLGGTFDTDEANNPDGPIAYKWYKLGAEMGDGVAMFNVATCHYRPTCAKEDVPLALQWYEKSSKAGYAEAEEWVEILREELNEE
jgi:TPR repeat protein